MKLFKHPTQLALAGCLVFAAANASAIPITFNTSEFTAFVAADLGDESSGLTTMTNPPDALPLFASAELSDDGNSSTAASTVNPGQFDVSTGALSTGRFAIATAGAGFSGEFTGTGDRFNFSIDFSNENEFFGDGSADAELFVTLISGGTTLFDQTFNTTQMIEQSFILSAGSSNLFDVQLISNSLADGSMDDLISASNVAGASFNINATPVPEPSMAWLMVGGLALVGVARRRALRAAIH